MPPKEYNMIVASMIIKVKPEKAEETAKLISEIPSITTYGVHKEDNIIAVIEAETGKELESLSQSILREFENVLGLYPTYLTTDESDGE